MDTHGPIIKKGRVEGLGWREIQGRVKAQTGTDVSHTALRNFWVKNMDGQAIDKMLETVRKATKAAIITDAQDEGQSPTVDISKVQEADALEGHERFTRLVDLLIDGNLTAHIETGERLKTEYVQYLRLLKQIGPNRAHEQ